MNKKAHLKLAHDELFEKGNVDAVEALFSSEYAVHAGGKTYNGHAFIHKFIKMLRTAIPDIKLKELIVLMEDGETIAWQRTLTGTHKSNLRGIPASGKKVVWHDMVVSRFESGKIVEEWTVSELAEKLLLSLPAPSVA